MRLLFIISALVFSDPCPAKAADSVAASDGMVQHVYRKDETLRYFFEDTDYMYTTKSGSVALRPETLRSMTDLKLNLKISVADVSSGTAHRRIEFSAGQYRSAAPDNYNQTPSVPLSSAIPGFPADFGYEYDSDGKVVNHTATFFQPYLSSDAGVFVYYKTMDIHTFQSIIDSISGAQKPGDIVIKTGKDIPLAMGIFKNANSVLNYHRVETVDRVRCAVFKVATLGNEFQVKGAGDTLQTDYQLTMFVPLEGEYQGLLLRGDLQEYVLQKPDTFVLRQLSMTLQRKGSQVDLH